MLRNPCNQTCYIIDCFTVKRSFKNKETIVQSLHPNKKKRRI